MRATVQVGSFFMVEVPPRPLTIQHYVCRAAQASDSITVEALARAVPLACSSLAAAVFTRVDSEILYCGSFDIDRPAAILNHGNLEADPVSLAGGFLMSAIRNGARHVVLCAGYEFPKIVAMGNNKIISTWAIATRPQPKSLWPQRALIWEASEPYLYLRSTFDGRVICGLSAQVAGKRAPGAKLFEFR